MTALLTRDLPLLAGAPNGIKKLRELILELAVRGKLVPQDPSDEPASELLKRIAEEKARLVTEGKIKRSKPLADIDKLDKPYELPVGWSWTTLPGAASYQIGKTPPTKDSRFWDNSGQPWVSISDMEHYGEINDTTRKVSVLAQEDVFKYLPIPAGTLLMSFKLTVGKVAMLAVDAYHNEAIISLSPYFGVSKDYLFRFLPSIALGGQQKNALMGNTLNSESMAQLLVPIPPVPEQHRIVAKVDELMALCDRLEARQADADSAHAQLVQALLDSLTQARDAEDFAQSWQRLAEHFHTLFNTESSINALKQTLLQLAVMGKLVPQDLSDESAEKLLKRISDHRSTYGDKRQKCLADISELEKPFDLPCQWIWTTLPAIGELARGKSKHRPRNDPSLYAGGGVPLIQTGDVARANGVVKTHSAMYNAKGVGQSRLWPAGTMCITIAANIADSAILSFDACFPDSVVGFIPDFPGLDIRYFEFFLRTAKSHLEDFAPSTAQKNINLEILGLLSVPLPPANEVRRIVAKVDQLMALCDQLKSRLSEARRVHEHLANTLIGQALNGEKKSGAEVVDFSAYLVSKLASQRTFGRVAHMKLLFLADSHLGLGLMDGYRRHAAGPLDTTIYRVEQRAAQEGLYSTSIEVLKSGQEKVSYHIGANISRSVEIAASALGAGRKELDRLIALFEGRKTDDLEAVATLYAVWNDALAGGLHPNDEWLINEFRSNWHEAKERFTPDILGKWLGWMRDHGLVPTGNSAVTKSQAAFLFS
ncbi:restriction endonuclease subunit S [Xanthomonas campestris pv. pennamericanum]|uniref:restriction endonuclease subunit S n=1 Tax=Xanthomonas euvesicatoria TaxID=456327 RepID=UPI001C4883CE|nr:restriction endonuclease subunit S [Xanthomonas euvesicatoria]MBV6811328.1 restriction endonuclease subunit S [Xanthomonas campestris pv. pennamericanum]